MLAAMLVLSRKLEETILIGDDIKVTVARIERDHVRLRIEAPREIPILREELLNRPARQDEGAPIPPNPAPDS